MWYDLQNRRPRDGVLEAEVRVPATSRWFDGHFPGHPVLPGIAQLAMVFDLIQGALGAPVRVLEVSRVRFKQMIRPEDHLRVWAEPRAGREGAYAFRVTRQEEVVCSGTMTVKQI
jgi:3-hydroxymyristoyl/3-hydroxydecanoyl-(acyl carrier protein) dehydratase